MTDQPMVITISHLLGSGGAYLGEKLSSVLGIPFLDREILRKVAEQLNLAEGELENREEHLSSYWQTFSRVVQLSDPTRSISADRYIPSDRELFQLESDTIGRIAEKSSAIFIGRCGSYILRNHPRHFSVFVYAEITARIKRLRELFHLTESQAKDLIKTNDKEREAYVCSFSKQGWLDPRLYDLCINTTSVGLDKTVDIVLSGVRAKLF